MEPDPRIFFAAERTLMAWMRTAVTLIALGFMVSKFGTFLKLLAGQPGNGNLVFSLFIGVGLVLFGTLVIAMAAVQHRRFVQGTRVADLPEGYSSAFGSWIALCLTLMGVVLALYLIFSARGLNLNSAVVN